jgi:hypothetical protein
MNNFTKFKVWSCKIVIPDVEIPDGFDFPPRFGAISVIEENNIKVLACFSGWGGTLTEGEREIVEYLGQKL